MPWCNLVLIYIIEYPNRKYLYIIKTQKNRELVGSYSQNIV